MKHDAIDIFVPSFRVGGRYRCDRDSEPAGEPLFAIYSERDEVVPLEANSELMKERYAALVGVVQLVVAPGPGHNMWQGSLQCRELVDFVIAQAKP